MNAFDTDQNDLIEYARAAVNAIRTRAPAKPVTVEEIARWTANAQALLDLDKAKALEPHSIGGLARQIIEKAIALLSSHTAPEKK